jgi:hypothetical protein
MKEQRLFPHQPRYATQGTMGFMASNPVGHPPIKPKSRILYLAHLPASKLSCTLIPMNSSLHLFSHTLRPQTLPSP